MNTKWGDKEVISMINPMNKSNVRRPLKGILLLLLLFIVSNTFISSVTQFVIVNRETSRIGAYYKSIGTIQPLDEDNYYIDEAQKIISGDPMIDYEDNRRDCLGIIEGLYNPDIRQHEDLSYDKDNDYTKFIGDCIFTAKVNKVYKAPSAESIYDGLGISITIKDRLAGFPDYIIEDIQSAIAVSAKSLSTGEKIKYINNNVIDDLLSLETGKIYLFRTYRDDGISKVFTMIKPLYTDGTLYEKLDDNGYIDWKNPKWSMLKEDMDVLNENIQSYMVTATRNMTAMPITQESMKTYYLKEGRWINQDDNIKQNCVCVINEDFANLRNISIGDKLEIQMRDTEKGSNYLTSAKDRRDWKTYKTSDPITFEVVGIFAFRDAHRAATRGREIYIPDSTLPEEFGNIYTQENKYTHIHPNDYSFTLKSTEDQSAFIEKYKEQLEKLGYKLYFVENNAESFWDSAKPIKHSALISFILFTVLLLLAHSFVVYLYVDGHKLNYAIERSLGIPAKLSGTHVILPLIIYGSIFSIIGGFLGYHNAIDKSERLLANLADISQVTVAPGLDIKYFFLFIIGLMTLFIVLLLLKIGQLKKTSIIDLINSNNAKKNVVKQNAIEEADKSKIELTCLTELDNNDEKPLKSSSKGALRGYSINHCLRSETSSLLLVMLAGIFVFSLLWMNYLMIRNNIFINKAYNETIVTGDIITNRDGKVVATHQGPISGTHIENLLRTELVKDYISIAHMWYSDMYIDRDGTEEKYEMREEDKKEYYIPIPSFEVRASNKMLNDRNGIKLTDLYLLDDYSLEDFNKNYRIDYTDKSHPMIVDEKGNKEIPILVSEKAMKDYGLKLGNRIALMPESREVLKTFFTIAGTFSKYDIGKTPYGFVSGQEESSLFIYPLSALQAMERTGVYYDILEFEFKPEKGRELLARKDELKNMVLNNIYDVYRNELKLWDEELIKVVDPLEKNLTLLKVLYPVTFTVSVLIAGILAFMMVLRRTLDVAILRVLGVKEKEVRKSLFMENIILTLIGISIAAIIILLITSGIYSIPLGKYAMVMGGYIFGTIVGLILSIGKVTRKKPLEMLQVKE